jgi:hypothetical protein
LISLKFFDFGADESRNFTKPKIYFTDDAITRFHRRGLDRFKFRGPPDKLFLVRLQRLLPLGLGLSVLLGLSFFFRFTF